MLPSRTAVEHITARERDWMGGIQAGIRRGNVAELLSTMDMTQPLGIGVRARSHVIGFLIHAKHNKPAGKKRVEMLAALLAHPDIALPEEDQRGAHLEKVIEKGLFGMIPLLHEAGFALPGRAGENERLTRLVAEGKWPYPNLISPFILNDRHVRWTIISKVLTKDFLKKEHLDKVVLLAKPPALVAQLSEQIAYRSGDAQKLVQDADMPQILDGLCSLLAHGWIDREQVRVAAIKEHGDASFAMQLLADADSQKLRRGTPQLSSGTTPKRRL